jgi:tRNA threonylcarbamoyladenosine biosynthesis protein TsaE
MHIENMVSSSENETIKMGNKFAQSLKLGDCVAFHGDLGAGKTEFIKGICDFFQVDELVTSPTYTIMNQYNGYKAHKDIRIFHVDLYRIKRIEELDEIGFEECIYTNNAIKLIEWSEKADGKLKKVDYEVNISLDDNDDNKRFIKIVTLN